MSELDLPPGFRFGAATAAFQIEGAWDADGKGPSNWDTLLHRRGGANGDVACGHYDRVEEDLELMARLGIDTYRFSVSWPRAISPKGLDFYERLVDGLLERGITPALTLYHWDHPQALEERGGWLDRDMPDRLGDYTELVAGRLGDRVGMWLTVNEPLSVMTAALNGMRLGGPVTLAEGMTIAEHLMQGHSLAMQRLPGQVGIALNLSGMTPASDDPADVAAAERAEALEDRYFLDRIGAVDFVGVNWYAPGRIAAAPESAVGYRREPFAGALTNMLGWPVLPDEFGTLLSWLRRNYPGLPPVYVTENGLPLPDRVGPDGTVRDPLRVDFMRRCLAQVAAAIRGGMDIRGYFAWSLLDNLEWDHGYGPRFGLVHVDFESLRRTPKESFIRYRIMLEETRKKWPD